MGEADVGLEAEVVGAAEVVGEGEVEGEVEVGIEADVDLVAEVTGEGEGETEEASTLSLKTLYHDLSITTLYRCLLTPQDGQVLSPDLKRQSLVHLPQAMKLQQDILTALFVLWWQNVQGISLETRPVAITTRTTK